MIHLQGRGTVCLIDCNQTHVVPLILCSFKSNRFAFILNETTRSCHERSQQGCGEILEEGRSHRASGRKQKYAHFTPEARTRVTKCAARYGNVAVAVVKHFTKEFLTLGEYSALFSKYNFAFYFHLRSFSPPLRFLHRLVGFSCDSIWQFSFIANRKRLLLEMVYFTL